ncbi:MAG: DUF1328 domain-containing protein [Burkholderiales bacterium]|jgi:uncharacterized membrane protein YtjA (UPF0391 family)|nr:DUF1328 domain-containing protein [Burkholderiales bacterium]
MRYAIVFFVIALITALFGFGGIDASATSIAKTLFIFAILAGGQLPLRTHQKKQ